MKESTELFSNLETTTLEEEFVESPSHISFRQKLSAVDDDEARIACQILVMDHPAIYIEMLGDYAANIRSDLDTFLDIMGKRKNYETDVHGGDKDVY